MSILSLSEVKSWLRIDTSDEDAELQRLIDAAELHAEKVMDRELESFAGSPAALPEDVRLGLRMMIADWYEHREAQAEGELRANPAADRLLHFHRENLGV